MALAASPAVTIAWSIRMRRIALLTFAALSLAAPAVAGDQVYIWRDQSGAVRFSPVTESQESRAIESTVVRDADARPQTDTAKREAY
jgi:hypothetical protein